MKKSEKKEFKLLNKFKTFWIRSFYEAKISLKSESLSRKFKDLIWILMGNIILAFGTRVFLLEHSLITGGTSGISIILEELTHGQIDVNLCITILTWVLFFLGFLTLGFRFAINTLISTIVFPPLLYLFSTFIEVFPWLSLSSTSEVSQLLSGIFGGVFVGVGCGLTFIGGGSTGGVDCLSLAANKYLHIKTSTASFLIDATIVLIGFIVFKNLQNCLIGIISAITSALMIDRVFLGQSTSFIAFITTKKYNEVSQRILRDMERGTTFFYAEGGYTGDDYKVVEVVFDRKEYRDLQAIIVDIDPHAFVTTLRAHEVNGDGFKKIKVNKKLSIDELKEVDKNLSEKDK